MTTTPIVLFTHKQKQYLEHYFRGGLEQWITSWGQADASFDIEIRSVETTSSDQLNGDVAILLVDCNRDIIRAVWRLENEQAHDLFCGLAGHKHGMSPTPKPSVLVKQVVQDALSDLLKKLVGCPKAEVRYDPARTDDFYLSFNQNLTSGFGLYDLTIRLGEHSLNVWIPKLCLQPVLPSEETSEAWEKPELAKTYEALSNQRVALNVVLGEAELTLADVVALQVGDVIRLDKSLDEPLYLREASSEIYFSGHLGQCDGSFAFQIETLITK